MDNFIEIETFNELYLVRFHFGCVIFYPESAAIWNLRTVWGMLHNDPWGGSLVFVCNLIQIKPSNNTVLSWKTIQHNLDPRMLGNLLSPQCYEPFYVTANCECPACADEAGTRMSLNSWTILSKNNIWQREDRPLFPRLHYYTTQGWVDGLFLHQTRLLQIKKRLLTDTGDDE